MGNRKRKVVAIEKFDHKKSPVKTELSEG